MLFKINFNIIKISQRAYIIVAKHIDSLQEGFVIALTKKHLNMITTILEDEKVSYTVEEIDAPQTPK